MKVRNFLCGIFAAILIFQPSVAAPGTQSGLTATEAAPAAQTETTADSETASSERTGLIDVTNVASYPALPEVSAESIILIEAKSGTILYNKNGDQQNYPASITKILTALIVIENCSLDEVVTFSYRATHELESGSSSIARTEGEQMTVRDCLYAMLIASANEVAQALAEHVSGSFEAFAELMNKRAAEIGCTNSHFTNPSGLHNDQHYTTCYDMALILAEAINNPTFLQICSTTSYTVPATNKHSESFGIAMKHELLRGENKYEYAVCGKTGYTSKAGFALATYAKKDNMDLICVTMHCDNSSERTTASKTLFNFGFNNYQLYNVLEADPDISSGGEETFLGKNLISLAVPEDSYIILPTSRVFSDLTSKLNWNVAATGSGIIGYVDYYYGQSLVGSAPLTADTTSDGTYDFLTDGTYEPEEEEDEETVYETAQRLIIITIIVVLSLVVLAIIFNRFVNGKRVGRRKRRPKVSHKVKRFK